MRIFYGALILIASIALPWWLVVPLWLVYAFGVTAYELIILGVLLDAYFGYVSSWHMTYTAIASGTYLLSELLKPRLSFYDRNSESRYL